MGNKKLKSKDADALITDALCSVFGNPIDGWTRQYNPERFQITVSYLNKEIWCGRFRGISGNPLEDGYSENEIKQRIALEFMTSLRNNFIKK